MPGLTAYHKSQPLCIRRRHAHQRSRLVPQECKRSAVSYISPEHILLAMLGLSECMGRRVLVRCVVVTAGIGKGGQGL